MLIMRNSFNQMSVFAHNIVNIIKSLNQYLSKIHIKFKRELTQRDN
jgi:hypothetical protein